MFKTKELYFCPYGLVLIHPMVHKKISICFHEIPLAAMFAFSYGCWLANGHKALKGNSV